MSLTRQSFILFVCVFFPYTSTVYGDDPVGVLLTGPEKAAVGDKVSFEVELVNRSGAQLSQLRVIDYFDKGLSHAVSSSPIEQAGTIVLAAGTSRRLTLEFQVVELGRQCHRVEILDQANKSVGSGTACVEAVPRNSPAAAQSAVGGNQLPSTKPPMQEGPGHPEVNTGQPGSVPQPPGSAFLPQIGGAQPSSTPPQPSTPLSQAGNVLEQTGPKREAGQVAGSGLPAAQNSTTPQELAPVPIVTPPRASESTAVPSVTMPNVGSLSTATTSESSI